MIGGPVFSDFDPFPTPQGAVKGLLYEASAPGGSLFFHRAPEEDHGLSSGAGLIRG